MLFTTWIFGVFFAIVLTLYWKVFKDNQKRKWLLLFASYIFYGAWDARFLLLIMLTTVVDYTVAQRIERSSSQPVRKRWLVLSLVVNLGMLGVFKYVGFFADSLHTLLKRFGVETSEVTLSIVLPVGISFFTFQTMSYTIDVYRGTLQARHRLLDFALFVTFFPHLFAGPIVRASHFLPQLDTPRRLENVAWRAAIGLFLVGFFKKAVIADTIGAQIDALYAAPESYDWISTWLAGFGYAAQIYCDFSGYTDMAIAVALMMGYSLGENFWFPYFSVNLTEFWRRWHISLSSWLRDYLYVPLGGNRGGTSKTYRNLMITMLLGGLWHGAAWTFVVWGGLHGVGLSAHRWWSARRGPVAPVSPAAPVAIASVVGTFLFVCFAWVFFRASSFADAAAFLGNIATFSSGDGVQVSRWIALYLVVALVLHYWTYRGVLQDWIGRLTAEQYAVAVGLASAFVLALRPVDSSPFIYFQF